MIYDDYNVSRRTASVKLQCDQAINIANNPQYDGYKKKLHQWFVKPFG